MTGNGSGSHIVERLKRLLPARLRGGAVVPVVRLSGVIGAVTPLRPGMSLAGVARLLERAFSTSGARAVALVRRHSKARSRAMTQRRGRACSPPDTGNIWESLTSGTRPPKLAEALAP